MAEIKEIKKPDAKSDDPKGRSQFSCPYFDLDSSIKVAEAVYSKGGGSCTPDQLAHWLGYTSIRSGTFLTRVSAAKAFGLIETSGEKFNVTERAKAIIGPVMPDDAVNAKVDAFLSVTLFSKVFDQFRGSQLPPVVGITNLFRGTYKIVNDRIEPSVRVFFNSAEQAGMLVGERDKYKLIKPAGGTSSSFSGALPKDEAKEEKTTEKPKGGGGGEGPPGGIHTAIVGVLRELPAPGSAFSAQDKQRFMTALRGVLDWVYPDREEPK